MARTKQRTACKKLCLAFATCHSLDTLAITEVRLKQKHILLCLGLFSSLTSFFFFGRAQGVFQLLLIGGLLVSLVSYLTILVHKGSWKSTGIWTGVVLGAILLNFLTEDFLIDSSYRYFVWSNSEDINRINNVVLSSSDNLVLSRNMNSNETASLSDSAVNEVVERLDNIGAYMVTKNEDQIYYGLFGFLDVRLGVTYVSNPSSINENFRQLSENWYR